MCRFIETVRVENGSIHNLDYHNRRMNQTRRAFFNEAPVLDLKDFIPAGDGSGRLKCRVEYAGHILHVALSPYCMRTVASLRLVEDDTVDYAFKYSDRKDLDRLFSQRNGADDIIVVRNGLLTDTSIANLALYNGSEWITPERPLLAGTKRMELLKKGMIREGNIPLSALHLFTRIALFNAMIDFGELAFPVNRNTILHAL